MLIRRGVGVEITPQTVRVAVVRRFAGRGWVERYREASLDPDVFAPSWEGENIRQEEAFGASLRGVLAAAGARRAPVRLVLPDFTARLRILESERPPADPRDLRDYAAWRLQEDVLSPGARIAPVFYMNGHPTRGYLAVLAAAGAPIGQIERLVHAAGARPVRITSLAAALFDFTDRALDGQWGRTAVLLVVAEPSATLIVVSDGVPVFVRTMRITWPKIVSSDASVALCRDVAETIDHCLDRAINRPDQVLLAGEYAHAPGLADALAQHLGIPCRVAGPNVRLLERGRVPPEGIGAVAAALC